MKKVKLVFNKSGEGGEGARKNHVSGSPQQNIRSRSDTQILELAYKTITVNIVFSLRNKLYKMMLLCHFQQLLK